MAGTRQARPLVTLLVVTGAHLLIISFLLTPPRLALKTKSGGLQLVWIPQPPLPAGVPERVTSTPRPDSRVGRSHADRSPAPAGAPPSGEAPSDADRAIHAAPDWTEELHLAAQNAVADLLLQKRHESDFAHAFPAAPHKPPEFAWDYAATHRVEALAEGGMLVHLSDNCVFILFPLPFVGCGIGKRPVNGDLFEHLGDQ